jgi:membrane protein implicated in regulation of membrane protease activity
MTMGWAWAIGALLLAIFELHAPGFYLIWVALGAGIAALATFLFGWPLEGQLATFAAASLASCVIGFFVYRRMLSTEPPEQAVNVRGRQMIGELAIVAEPIRNGHGKIRFGDTVWLAEGPDLPEGAPVVVTGVRGTTAIVDPAGERA